MGGGNAQKSAAARAKKAEKAGKDGVGGGGAAGIAGRTGNTAGAMGDAAAKRNVRKKNKQTTLHQKKRSPIFLLPTFTHTHSARTRMPADQQAIKEEQAAKKAAKAAADAKKLKKEQAGDALV